jgi:hypothetical protein
VSSVVTRGGWETHRCQIGGTRRVIVADASRKAWDTWLNLLTDRAGLMSVGSALPQVALAEVAQGGTHALLTASQQILPIWAQTEPGPVTAWQSASMLHPVKQFLSSKLEQKLRPCVVTMHKHSVPAVLEQLTSPPRQASFATVQVP